MNYTVKTTQNAAGLWNWSIYKGDLLAETGTSKAYTTEAEAVMHPGTSLLTTWPA